MKRGQFSLGAMLTPKPKENTDEKNKFEHSFNNHQVSESTMGRYKSSEYKMAHVGEPDDAILEEHFD